jgi:hypothetical protein
MKNRPHWTFSLIRESQFIHREVPYCDFCSHCMLIIESADIVTTKQSHRHSIRICLTLQHCCCFATGLAWESSFYFIWPLSVQRHYSVIERAFRELRMVHGDRNRGPCPDSVNTAGAYEGMGMSHYRDIHDLLTYLIFCRESKICLLLNGAPDTVSRTHNLGIGWIWVVSFTLRPPYPRRRPVAFEGRSGCSLLGTESESSGSLPVVTQI